ncbi:hypothetical protein BJX99DRAFT_242277, partial [Aspergillus californicus]
MGKSKHTTSWKEKRQTQSQSHPYNMERKARAERERFRRGKSASFKRLNELYLDGLETGRERHIFTVIASKSWGGKIRYTTYNTHADEDWVPSQAIVAKISPMDKWTPGNIQSRANPAAPGHAHASPAPAVVISRPPPLNLPPTPKL